MTTIREWLDALELARYVQRFAAIDIDRQSLQEPGISEPTMTLDRNSRATLRRPSS